LDIDTQLKPVENFRIRKGKRMSIFEISYPCYSDAKEFLENILL
jgi:hypothetical protein